MQQSYLLFYIALAFAALLTSCGLAATVPSTGRPSNTNAVARERARTATAGPDGRLWFSETKANKIAAISP
jgi:hypothetical protein